MLQLGSKGPEVKSLQEKLIARGYSVGSYGADGDFGQGTHDAVVRFQRDHGLDADGIVGPATMRAIDGSIGTTLLRKGDKGPAVKELQQKLITRGYSVGSYGADGDFGQGTHDAVVRFQRDNGLDADGIVGVATWGALNGFSNGKLLKLGDRGPEVKSLQEKLITRGYSVGSYGADGDFGQGTHDAVVRFQRDNRLDADGIVGPATWEVLNGINGNLILKLGDKGSAVKELQQKLITRGYSVGSYGADGDFGQGTHDAVVRFQRDNGLDADGVVGPATWAALGANNTLLRLGSKGAEVKRLQEALIKKGYSVGSYGADGDFGQGTHDAVVRFQRDNGLDADGVVGPATWSALNGFNDWNPGIGGSAGVKKFLEVAKSQIGVKETPVNITPYGAWYGMQDYWCAMFISWCANQSGILGTLVPKFAWCEGGANWYRNKGRFLAKSAGNPDPGDILFFYNRASNPPYYHVGIVEYVSNGRVHTIEGNSDDAVRRRDYSLNYSDILGYGRNGGIIDTNSDNEENFLKNLKKLEQITKELVGSNANTWYINTLVMEYFRHIQYNDSEWQLVLGKIPSTFINYVKDKYSDTHKALLPYFQNGSKLIKIGGSLIDLPHLAATILGYTNRDVIEFAVPNFWTGWGGDLATGMSDVTKLIKSSNKNEREAAIIIIGGKSTISKVDIEADLDAIYFEKKINAGLYSNLLKDYYYNQDKREIRKDVLCNDVNLNYGISIESLSKKIKSEMTGIRGFEYPIAGKKLLGKATYEGIEPTDKVIQETCYRFAEYVFNIL